MSSMSIHLVAGLLLLLRAQIVDALCSQGCGFGDSNATIFAWYRSSQASTFLGFHAVPVTTVTATVVTIIDTIRHVTSTTTSFPPGVTAHPTVNSKGTRIETVTYSRSGLHHTTIMTYPTPLVAWPDAILWTGSLLVTDPVSRCAVAPTGGQIVPLPGNPQATGPYDSYGISRLTALNATDFAEDPKGLDCVLMAAVDDDWPWTKLSTLWPSQPALTSCTVPEPMPNWGAFTQTNWYTKHVVQSVG